MGPLWQEGSYSWLVRHDPDSKNSFYKVSIQWKQFIVCFLYHFWWNSQNKLNQATWKQFGVKQLSQLYPALSTVKPAIHKLPQHLSVVCASRHTCQISALNTNHLLSFTKARTICCDLLQKLTYYSCDQSVLSHSSFFFRSRLEMLSLCWCYYHKHFFFVGYAVDVSVCVCVLEYVVDQ